jgi:type IVB pilus formation R64 PilN family outer membrane protein
MPIRNRLIGAAALAGAALLAGCYNREMAEVVKEQVSSDFDTTQDALDRARVPGRPINKDIIAVSDDIWLGDGSFVAEHNNPLPKQFETNEGRTLMTDGPVKFDDLINQINFLTGISVQIEDSVDPANLKDMGVSYTGNLTGLLNMVALKISADWSYDGGKIVFYKFKTRTFVLHTLATESTFSSNVNSGSDGATTMSTTANIKEWTEITDVLKSIVKDGEVQMSPSTNSITVTSTPKTLDRVEAYVKEVNRRLVKQVAISVRVMEVTLNKGNDFGLNLDAIFSNSRYSFASASSNSVSQPSTPGALSFIVGGGEGADGSTAIFGALSQQGKTSLVTSAVLTTRNNRVAPLNNLTTTQYISSISTLTENTNSTTEITPAEVSEGFSMQIMPNILENGKLMLLFSMSLRTVMEWQRFSAGSTTLELPTVAQRNFMQELVMESGQTAVLTGFERISNENTTQGLGTREFTALGGSMKTAVARNVLVVMLTPQIIESPMETDDNSNESWGMPNY